MLLIDGGDVWWPAVRMMRMAELQGGRRDGEENRGARGYRLWAGGGRWSRWCSPALSGVR